VMEAPKARRTRSAVFAALLALAVPPPLAVAQTSLPTPPASVAGVKVPLPRLRPRPPSQALPAVRPTIAGAPSPATVPPRPAPAVRRSQRRVRPPFRPDFR
jgi:hypothetical protein